MRKTEYKYQVGEVVNDTLKIVRQTRSPNGKNKTCKSYEVQSLVYPDAPTYISSESTLKRGCGCSYKYGKRVYVGNSLYSVEHIRPYLIDIKEAKKIAKNSTKKINFKCSQCNIVKKMAPYTLIKHGIMCPKCSKGTSYPELFMMAYLEVKGIEYEYQKVFDDLPNRRFDFYLPKENVVIETHGAQHYSNSSAWNNLNTTTQSDKEKQGYCRANNISYTEIDARKSNFKFIKDSVTDSNLSNINSKENELILKHIENNKRYCTKEIVKLYKEGRSTIEIAKIYNISYTTISNILLKNGISIRTVKQARSKPVRCVNTNEIFNSISEACVELNISNSARGNISSVCKGKRSYAGKHPITGEKLKWEYVVDIE